MPPLDLLDAGCHTGRNGAAGLEAALQVNFVIVCSISVSEGYVFLFALGLIGKRSTNAYPRGAARWRRYLSPEGILILPKVPKYTTTSSSLGLAFTGRLLYA